MMAGMMVPMIRVVSPFILGAYHGQIDVHHWPEHGLDGMTTRLGRSRRGFGLRGPV